MSEQKVETGTGTESKPGSFYSVNLTDKRIVVIFAVIVGFFALAAFIVIMLLTSNLKENRADDNRLFMDSGSGSEGELFAEEGEFEDLNFHSELENDAIELTPAEEEPPAEGEEPEAVVEESGESVEKPEEDEELHSSQFKDESEKSSEKSSTNKVIIPVNNSTREQRKVEATTTVKKNETVNKESTTVKTTSESSTTKKSYSKRYIVQVGSYRNKETADKIEAFYKNGGYPTYVKSFAKDGTTYYRLRIGPFKEKERADKYLLALKESKYGENSYVTIGYF